MLAGYVNSGSEANNNLNKGNMTAPEGKINDYGFINVRDNELRLGLNGLNDTLWVAGTDSQFPMLKSVNAAYQDLRRINSTQDGRNQFPDILNEFAEPGNDTSASLFDRSALYYLLDSYLLFLKSISHDRAIKAGINCDAGVFFYHCPMPGGNPEFQVFDPDTHHLYVVAYQPENHQFLLIRYRADGSLDKSFGDCGSYAHQAAGLPSSFTVTSGLYHKENNQRFIDLFTSHNGQPILVRLNIDQAESQAGYSTVESSIDVDTEVYSMSSHESAVYFTGRSGDDVLLDHGIFQVMGTNGQQDEAEAGYALIFDNKDAVYVTGQKGNDLLIRKYKLSTLNPELDFGVSGLVTDSLPEARGQAMVLHNPWLYVIGNTNQKRGDLFNVSSTHKNLL